MYSMPLRKLSKKIRDEVASWGYRVTGELVTGNPETELPPRIRKLSPSVLAIGFPSTGEFGQLVLGSVAEILLEEVSCPLLIFPL